MNPPRFLSVGDVVRCSASGIGHIENHVVAGTARTYPAQPQSSRSPIVLEICWPLGQVAPRASVEGARADRASRACAGDFGIGDRRKRLQPGDAAVDKRNQISRSAGEHIRPDPRR